FRKLARTLGIATLAFIAIVSIAMPFLQETFRARWFSWPAMLYAAPVPILVMFLAWRFFNALQRHEELAPFLCALGLFLLSYAGLCISMWPHIVPPSITIWEAATAPASQMFLLIGTLFLLPLILIYTGYVYWLFRGKVTTAHGYH
ncbi:MAG TPA: cytochrome d ubiquinol oxidase subunit II, partial [Burkholderiaceae bacterium]|nr:cytochrome d ubiquinol oxidase subunit II [Burkholderiaceae bacterium]